MINFSTVMLATGLPLFESLRVANTLAYSSPYHWDEVSSKARDAWECGYYAGVEDREGFGDLFLAHTPQLSKGSKLALRDIWQEAYKTAKDGL